MVEAQVGSGEEGLIMPIPTPRGNESRSAFVSRCVDDATMKREYPNQQQRVAICEKQYDEKKHALLIEVLTRRGYSPCQIKAEIAKLENN